MDCTVGLTEILTELYNIRVNFIVLLIIDSKLLWHYFEENIGLAHFTIALAAEK